MEEQYNNHEHEYPNEIPMEELEPLSDPPTMLRLFLYFYDDEYSYIAGSEGEYNVPAGETIPNSTEVRPPNALYKAKLNEQAQEWYEAATQDEIKSTLNRGTPEPSTEDLLMLQVAELYEANLRLQADNDTAMLAIADLYERGIS